MIGSAISAREKVGQWAAAHWLLWELEAMKVLAGCWSGTVEQKAVRLLRKLPILPLLHVLARGDLRRQVTKQSVIAHSLAKQRPRIQPIYVKSCSTVDLPTAAGSRIRNECCHLQCGGGCSQVCIRHPCLSGRLKAKVLHESRPASDARSQPCYKPAKAAPVISKVAS